MSNSSLVQYVKLSPYKNDKEHNSRTMKIDCIAIHCVVGQCAVESLGDRFQWCGASSNYGIGYDGKVALYVEESDRAWTTSTYEDNRAVTIEVASDTTEPYAVKPAAWASLLNLVEDVCRRNGIKKLIWSDKKEDRVNHKNGVNIMCHRDYENKSCPGTYIYSRLGSLAEEINKRLGVPAPTPSPEPKQIKPGDKVKIVAGAVYTNGKVISDIIRAETWIVKAVNGSTVLIDKSVAGGWSINSTVDAKYLTVVSAAFEPYIIRVEVDALNIRLAPTTLATVVGTIRDRGAYTIVQEADGRGATRWGRLKSGAGWISLDYCRVLRKA